MNLRGATLALALAALATGCSKDVQIGGVISESGAVASYGDKVKKGMDLAVEELNAAGTLYSGGKVSVVYKDDATIPERGRQVTQELIDDGIRLIIGGISSRVALAIAPVAEKNHAILLSPTASAPELSEAGDYIFRNYPSDIREGTSMAKFAKDLGLERVAVFALDNEFGHGLSEVFRQQYESRFRQVVETFRFEDGDVAAFPAMVAQLPDLHPDGIYIIAYESDLARLLELIADSKVDAVVMSCSAVTPDVVRRAGTAAENLVYPQSTIDLDSADPVVSSFVQSYRAKYGSDPDIFSAHGYDAVRILVEAINMNESSHPDDVKIGLKNLQNFQGAAGPTTFDASGDVIRHPRLLIIRQGQPMPYERFVEEGGSILAHT